MSQQKIWRMSELSRGQSDKWIRQQYNAAIKAANDRIKTVSQEKYSGRSQAYEYYVKGDLAGAPYVKQRGGATVFKALPRGASRRESLEALRMVERFLGAKTSTAAGIQEVARERESSLNRALEEEWKARGGSGSGPRDKLTREQADNVLRWMGSEEGKAAKAQYDSHQVREAISKAVVAAGPRSGKTVSNLYNDFKKSQETLADWIFQSESKLGWSF